MSVTREDILKALSRVVDPGQGKDLVAADMVRAPVFENGTARFILEVDPARGREMGPVLKAAEAAVGALPGVTKVQGVLTAHGPAAPAQPAARGPAGVPPPPPGGAPNLKIGRHPQPQASKKIPGVDKIIAVGSGKGGVGKSTVSANLAVALARAGKRVGLLDADIHGPSQARMLGLSERPRSDGETIIPLQAHGLTAMSIGLMLPEDEAVIWRGPMLMGALQQMMNQVRWGELDVLVVDLPPGTGDVALSLCQKAEVTGAIIVSTPQDVALLDAKKAVAMFRKLETPILGLVENMSVFVCPHCGQPSHIFGHDGAKAEAQRLGLPFLGEIPLHLDIRVSGDEGAPIVARDPDGPQAQAFHALAAKLIDGGLA
ncbi:Mrp/NBP35 family ATP-binding protein [Albimonas sp. CAU 1670]|uniref:Mrp/NBP35 family ATP-binding protein n=1 Tax=Albimonas sp. CAU 1670 TaxID=3032599 RepID=UPI0023D98E53|nr:Mrp/NBP35 family ATP-binding protein [Albimonas sp. CAU 1670]MDF2232816.1 Mrp/NBP35 family ATP-binding protein [Albimonas sp. CAU 1670]